MHYDDAFWPSTPYTLQGFEELHQFVKQGNEFCKEAAIIFNEKADAELAYSKALQKIGRKAKGASKLCIGSMGTAWQQFVEHLESISEAHKNLSISLLNEAHKPMKMFVDGQVKQRKPVEQAVKDSHRQFMDRRNEEMRAKKQSHAKSRECKLLWDQLDANKSGSKALSEKDAAKLDTRYRRAEEAVVKADHDYKENNRKSESARLTWEASMHRCCTVLENLEGERLNYMRNTLCKYSELKMTVIPTVQTSCKGINTEAQNISPEDDIRTACETHGIGPNQPEQLLYDCYEQDLANPLDSERRSTNLSRKIRDYTEDINRQVKTKEGIDNLKKVYDSTPGFCDEKALEDVNRQLYEADAMLNLFKANRYQLMCAQCDLESRAHPIEAYNEYINTTKDKGMNSSIMRIPQEVFPSLAASDIDYPDHDMSRKPSVNHTHQRPPDTTNLIELSNATVNNDGSSSASLDDEFNDEANNDTYVTTCRALYDYEPQQSDELRISEGDIINVIDKQEDDWWQGELYGQVGIFPATYVEETSI